MGCNCGKPSRAPRKVRIVQGKIVYLDETKDIEPAEPQKQRSALATVPPPEEPSK